MTGETGTEGAEGRTAELAETRQPAKTAAEEKYESAAWQFNDQKTGQESLPPSLKEDFRVTDLQKPEFLENDLYLRSQLDYAYGKDGKPVIYGAMVGDTAILPSGQTIPADQLDTVWAFYGAKPASIVTASDVDAGGNLLIVSQGGRFYLQGSGIEVTQDFIDTFQILGGGVSVDDAATAAGGSGVLDQTATVAGGSGVTGNQAAALDNVAEQPPALPPKPGAVTETAEATAAGGSGATGNQAAALDNVAEQPPALPPKPGAVTETAEATAAGGSGATGNQAAALDNVAEQPPALPPKPGAVTETTEATAAGGSGAQLDAVTETAEADPPPLPPKPETVTETTEATAVGGSGAQLDAVTETAEADPPPLPPKPETVTETTEATAAGGSGAQLDAVTETAEADPPPLPPRNVETGAEGVGADDVGNTVDPATSGNLEDATRVEPTEIVEQPQTGNLDADASTQATTETVEQTGRVETDTQATTETAEQTGRVETDTQATAETAEQTGRVETDTQATAETAEQTGRVETDTQATAETAEQTGRVETDTQPQGTAETTESISETESVGRTSEVVSETESVSEAESVGRTAESTSETIDDAEDSLFNERTLQSENDINDPVTSTPQTDGDTPNYPPRYASYDDYMADVQKYQELVGQLRSNLELEYGKLPVTYKDGHYVTVIGGTVIEDFSAFQEVFPSGRIIEIDVDDLSTLYPDSPLNYQSFDDAFAAADAKKIVATTDGDSFLTLDGHRIKADQLSLAQRAKIELVSPEEFQRLAATAEFEDFDDVFYGIPLEQRGTLPTPAEMTQPVSLEDALGNLDNARNVQNPADLRQPVQLFVVRDGPYYYTTQGDRLLVDDIIQLGQQGRIQEVSLEEFNRLAEMSDWNAPGPAPEAPMTVINAQVRSEIPFSTIDDAETVDDLTLWGQPTTEVASSNNAPTDLLEVPETGQSTSQNLNGALFDDDPIIDQTPQSLAEGDEVVESGTRGVQEGVQESAEQPPPKPTRAHRTQILDDTVTEGDGVVEGSSRGVQEGDGVVEGSGVQEGDEVVEGSARTAESTESQPPPKPTRAHRAQILDDTVTEGDEILDGGSRGVQEGDGVVEGSGVQEGDEVVEGRQEPLKALNRNLRPSLLALTEPKFWMIRSPKATKS